jgi:hypothetical protein
MVDKIIVLSWVLIEQVIKQEQTFDLFKKSFKK